MPFPAVFYMHLSYQQLNKEVKFKKVLTGENKKKQGTAKTRIIKHNTAFCNFYINSTTPANYFLINFQEYLSPQQKKSFIHQSKKKKPLSVYQKVKEKRPLKREVVIKELDDCRYCYASAIDKRFKKHPDREWKEEKIRIKDVEKNYPRFNGRVGIPSSHDITPATLYPVKEVIRKLVAAGNEILVVSKPRVDCIKNICDEFYESRSQFLFRFTVSTMDNELIKFWKPNAPLYEERKEALKYAYEMGYQTSDSMEPLLDSENVIATIHDLAPYVTDSIWLGKMNNIPSMKDKDGNPPGSYEQEFIDKIRMGQTPDRIKEIYRELQEYPDLFPLIKFKDSYKKVLGLEAATAAGMDV